MTLIVSLRIPDGIIIAGDSLSTMMANRQFAQDIEITCSKCNHASVTNAKIPIRTSTNFLSYAQKIFPFMKAFGIGTFGEGHITGKTIYFAIRELEQELLRNGSTTPALSEICTIVGEYIQGLLFQHFKQNTQKDEINFPDGYYPIGFQIVGYEQGSPTLTILQIGKDIKTNTVTGLGINWNGQLEVVDALFSRFQSHPEEKPVFEIFSLQDAITYAEFLIRTTSIYQRFSSNMATVGGDIDIALITPFNGFEWINQKSLQTKL